MPLSADDTKYLERAVNLAARGRGATSPNPMVGAVIVRDGAVIGEGFHAGPGRQHAEVAAVNDALRRQALPAYDPGTKAGAEEMRGLCTGTTMYVTLEPCCTFGRTPPCTDTAVLAGFARLVVGAVDPSPAVDGKGIALLRAAGIQVDLADGEIAHRIRRQNDGHRKAVTRGLPFVTYKYAMTIDGRVATDQGDSRWISSPESRALVHRWRSWSDAVVVGAGTQQADDPRLTARDIAEARQPLRVVVDRDLGLRRESALVRTVHEGPVLVLCGPEAPARRRSEVTSWGVETVPVPLDQDGCVDPLEAGRHLAGRDVRTVLLEGGPRLAAAWWRAGLVDRVAAFVCPKVAAGIENRGALRGPGPSAMPAAESLQEVEIIRVGPDALITGYREGPF